MNTVVANTALPEPLAGTVALHQLIPSPEATACLPEDTARRLQAVPLSLQPAVAGSSDQQVLYIACGNPADDTLLDRLSRQLPMGLRPHALPAEAGDINAALDKCYTSVSPAAQSFSDCRSAADALQMMREQPDCLIRLLEWILLCASRQGASDIHLSPDAGLLQVRFRVDGVLHSFAAVSSAMHGGLLVRIKILAAMDIAETRHPQDGQFLQFIDARNVEFRVSCFPTTNGQNAVLRLLDPQRKLDSLAALSLPKATQHRLAELVRRPDGLLVVCGPTGSGKSTTLHALLGERDAASLNIMTLEDPVEQAMPGIQQTSIDAGHAMDYAQGVRALLRQDPDVLLIGEVRDTDSCAMAFRAVMSGHQLLTTVHAGSALSGLSRLRELGALPALLGNNLLAIAAQRLVRRLCLACRGSTSGCGQCRQTGYRGRQVIMELLVVTPRLATLIAADASQQVLLECALREGFVPLLEHGQRMVDQGCTSKEEMERVLGSMTAVVLPRTSQGDSEHEQTDQCR